MNFKDSRFQETILQLIASEYSSAISSRAKDFRAERVRVRIGRSFPAIAREEWKSKQVLAGDRTANSGLNGASIEKSMSSPGA